MSNGEGVWILLDGRARTGMEDRASVMDTADSEKEARHAGLTIWADHDAIWLDPDGNLRFDLPPVPKEIE